MEITHAAVPSAWFSSLVRWSSVAASFGLGVSIALPALTTTVAAQGSTRVVSRSSTGELANDNIFEPSISADGRYVSFHAQASNLVEGDTNDDIDVFVHDTWTGKTLCASVDPAGQPGNNHSEFSAISADGRYVAFESIADNLVPGPSVVSNGIYVRDLLLGVTTCASLSPTGQHAASECHSASISGDGRYVAFTSWADNLVVGDTNDRFDVFVHDRTSGTTVRASVSTSGAQADDGSQAPTISVDGRYVVFNSNATNLVPGDTNGFEDIFVRDLQLGVTTRVSVDSAGVQGNGSSGVSFGPTVTSSISADGRYVAFNSRADNLVSGDTNGADDVFVHDRVTGMTRRVSVGSAGGQADAASIDPRLSADGTQIAFASLATNLVGMDVNGAMDVFVHDVSTGVTSLVSLSTTDGQGLSDSWEPAMSADGRWVAFHGYGPGLAPGVSGPLAAYVRDRSGNSVTLASYGTSPITSHGCVPVISATGIPSATAGSGFHVDVSSVEGQSLGIVFYGISGPRAIPFGGGAGLLFVKNPLQRTPAQSSGGTGGACDGHLTIDWNQLIVGQPGIVGGLFAGGETVWIQAWFRDAGAPGGAVLSNALWFNVCR